MSEPCNVNGFGVILKAAFGSSFSVPTMTFLIVSVPVCSGVKCCCDDEDGCKARGMSGGMVCAPAVGGISYIEATIARASIVMRMHVPHPCSPIITLLERPKNTIYRS